MGFFSWLSGLFGGSSSSPSKAPNADGTSPRTRLEGLDLIDVIDGDTVRVMINGVEESLRLLSLDTEESHGGGSKPVTRAGKMASEMAKKYFAAEGGGWSKVSIEFDTNEPVEDCLRKHRGTYGRLLCYLWKGDEHYNHKAIAEGWSPYFVKYGPSRLYDESFAQAHDKAKKSKLVIWDPKTNEGGPTRDYEKLLPWWSARGALVKRFREEGTKAGALDVREDYDKILAAMKNEKTATIFCDLQQGIHSSPGDGSVIYAGSKAQPFNLWIPNSSDGDRKSLIEVIEKEYAGKGKGYAYITGKLESYKDRPQINLTTRSQLSDQPK